VGCFGCGGQEIFTSFYARVSCMHT
jgi:hypothetical protein